MPVLGLYEMRVYGGADSFAVRGHEAVTGTAIIVAVILAITRVRVASKAEPSHTACQLVIVMFCDEVKCAVWQPVRKLDPPRFDFPPPS